MRAALEAHRIDLIVLDLMLPGDDGLGLCREVRSRSNMPIVMLTALGEDVDRIVGLEMGADDYVPKPFNPRELLARIKAVLRRTEALPSGAGVADGEVASFAGWRFDLRRRELIGVNGMMVPLSTGEFTLLVTFIRHPQRVLTRDQLLDLTRGREAEPFDRSVDTQVSRLRRKIEADPRNPVIVKTVRGGGYVFTATVKFA
jgi:two-component system OmpR family response regulator